MEFDIKHIILKDLFPGETIRWNGKPIFICLFIMIFGLYILLGRLIVKKANKKNSNFAITSDSVSLRKDGSGTINFGSTKYYFLMLRTVITYIIFTKTPERVSFHKKIC